MKIRIRNIASLFLAGIIFMQCAKISSPQGGPEDETPPVLLSSLPRNEQTNYTSNTIQLNFDEYIRTQGIENNLIITPAIKGTFKSKVVKRTLLLTFDSAWAENTTYNINFGNTIQDITNRNIPPDLYLSFSTGDYLDSLQINGIVNNLYSKEPAEEALVSLYAVTDTLDITSGAAAYYARTDTAGSYTFKNLPGGSYFVYAAIDENNNFKADVDEELYGFYKDTLHLSENLTGIDFDLQRLNLDSLEIETSRTYGKYYDVEFSKAVTDYEILNNDSIPYRLMTPTQLRFYPANSRYNDTIPVIISANDSINSQLVDTVQVFFKESDIATDPFEFEIEPKAGAAQPSFDFKLTFTKPVKSYNPDSLIVEIDSLNRFQLPDSLFTWNTNRTEAVIPFNLRDYITEDQRLSFQFKPAAFISVEDDSTQNKIKNLQPLKLDDSGIILGTINTNAPNYIIQLLNSRTLEVLDQRFNESSYRFEYLNAGSYLVKLIIDTNGNGVWDIGNLLTRTNAEPIIYYFDSFTNSRVVELRKNWEVNEIDISYSVNKQD